MEIQFYVKEDGHTPFTEWLDALRDRQARARIRTRLERVAMGNFGDRRSVGGGVWELRFTFGPGYRVYYGIDGDTVVLLLCGGDKSTQAADISRAKKYWAEYSELE